MYCTLDGKIIIIRMLIHCKCCNTLVTVIGKSSRVYLGDMDNLFLRGKIGEVEDHWR